MKTLKVRAAPGLTVPQELSPRLVITDDEYLEVPASAYYLRRIQSKELEVFKPEHEMTSDATEGKVKRGVSNGKS
ncbi:hypothetical protein [Oligella urethralis]|uniref:hypothetical protein n=1 Tax=Oligella urethralis TaxID=90245 RepID=UPI00288C50F4|nr:hypothetical protein [Oligella urethralis]